MTPHYQDATVHLYAGDCLDILATLPDNSVDAVVTDPPYGLEFMGKEWDKFDRKGPASFENLGQDWSWTGGSGKPTTGDRPYVNKPRFSTMGSKAMRAFQDWCEQWAAECLRVLKPGGHLLAFGGTRTWHRLACAIEDAGFEVRDSIAWLYGSGFPKSLDVSKAIDKRPGVARHAEFAADLRAAMDAKGYTNTFDVAEAVIGRRTGAVANWQKYQLPEAKWWPALRDLLDMDEEKWGPVIAEAERQKVGTRAGNRLAVAPGQGMDRSAVDLDVTEHATPDAARWQGWGTALKPAFEPVVVARKPLVGTVAQNVLTYGTGALNIAATRIGSQLDSVGSSGGYSNGCTCPSPEGARTNRSQSTPLRASSDVAPAGRSVLPASAPQDESDRPQPLGSPADCQSSPHSGGEPAQSEAGGVRASAQPRPDADMSHGRCVSCGRNRSARSKAHPDYTAPNVERTGRWPANVVLDESQADALDQMSGEQRDGVAVRRNGTEPGEGWGRIGHFDAGSPDVGHGGSGGASRFFYTSKAASSERVRIDGIAHPTVKPLDLMRWLVRLVTPPGGTVLEPFAGSGTTVEACILEGFRCIAIEREADYLPLIVQRINRRRNPVEAVRGSGEDGGLFDLLDEETA